jgi:8-oxo-dGTP diphosphatase
VNSANPNGKPVLGRGSHIIVSAAIVADDHLLLVRQPGPDGPGTVWALPGGRADAGELALEAVYREVAEETGFKLSSHGSLVALGQLVNPTNIRRDPGELPGPGETATVFIFAFRADSGDLSSAEDPDGEIAEAVWIPADEAYARVANHPFPFMREISKAAITSARRATPILDVQFFRRNEQGDDIQIGSIS